MSDVKVFALDTLERAGKSVLQGVAVAAATILPTVDAAHVTSAAWWQQTLLILGSAALYGVFSVLSSIGSAAKTGTASLSRTVAETAVPQPQPAGGATFGDTVYAPDPTAPETAAPAAAPSAP